MLQVIAKNKFTRGDLQAFTQRVADAFNAGEIHAPVHLSGGNEDQLIDIFSEIGEDDWICSTWRSHYHCLLAGVPPERLMSDIRAGRSISLCYPEYRILSSAIVGGNLPIALGIAWSIKARKGTERVWAFSGDMAARTGMFRECIDYAAGHDLPVTFVIEDNGKSVCTDTRKTWGDYGFDLPPLEYVIYYKYVTYYQYKLPWPHSGAGKRVNF